MATPGFRGKRSCSSGTHKLYELRRSLPSARARPHCLTRGWEILLCGPLRVLNEIESAWHSAWHRDTVSIRHHLLSIDWVAKAMLRRKGQSSCPGS